MEPWQKHRYFATQLCGCFCQWSKPYTACDQREIELITAFCPQRPHLLPVLGTSRPSLCQDQCQTAIHNSGLKFAIAHGPAHGRWEYINLLVFRRVESGSLGQGIQMFFLRKPSTFLNAAELVRLQPTSDCSCTVLFMGCVTNPLLRYSPLSCSFQFVLRPTVVRFCSQKSIFQRFNYVRASRIDTPLSFIPALPLRRSSVVLSACAPLLFNVLVSPG